MSDTTLRQVFTILWVEDKPNAMKAQAGHIEKYLIEREFDPVLIFDETGEKVKEIMQEGNIDIVVIDWNISETINGVDVVRLIRDENFLTDILFYSALRSFTRDKILSQTEHYRFIEVIEGKDIEEPLKRLMEKNIKRCQDIVFLRGMIISRIVDLEQRINDFLAEYFKISDEVKKDFYDLILENKLVSQGAKIEALETIVEKCNLGKEFKKCIQALRALSNKRNLVAHCRTDPDDRNVLISMGKLERFGKTELHGILKDIREVSGELDKLADEVKSRTGQ